MNHLIRIYHGRIYTDFKSALLFTWAQAVNSFNYQNADKVLSASSQKNVKSKLIVIFRIQRFEGKQCIFR